MVEVAIDEGPLHGPRTGIGNAVAEVLDALALTSRRVQLRPYVTSTRAEVEPPTRRLPIPAFVAHRWWARSSRPRVDRWLGRPDLVHGTNYVVPPTHCPRLVSVYDCWFLAHPELAAGDVARAGAVLRRSIADGAHVVTSSDATTSQVRDLLDTDRVTTVHLGPPSPVPHHDRATTPTPTRLAPLEARRFALALGTTERRKNLPVLVRSFGRLAAELDDVRLVIAGGPGDDEVAITTAVEALPASARERVHRLGRVDDGERRWLLGRAAALAYPSLDEGFGFPVLEAQQVGVPVVTTPVGSIPEVAGAAALYGAPDDVDALAANLHLVITNPDRAATLIERGRANVDRFSWERTADAYVDLYGRLVEEAR